LKKIIPLFLLLVICVSHLNIVDALYDLRYKKENLQSFKKFPADEESGSEKSNDLKSKHEEEKFFHSLMPFKGPSFSNTNTFFYYNTQLQLHPYQDDDIQPPKAA
jgi:hypothetical protein